MFTVQFARRIAGRSFDLLPRSAQLRFNRTFDPLARHPRSATEGLDVHQLSGYQNVWTLRIHPWRGIYAIDGSVVVFIVFGHRSDVYPRLHALLPPMGRYISAASADSPSRDGHSMP